jgi:hypothetical protein
MKLVMAILTWALVFGTAAAQGAEPTQEALDELQRYLLVDCGYGEEETALSRLMRHADALEPELERLLFEGPPDALLDEISAALEQEWERRAAFLESNPQLGLDPDALLAVLSTSHAEFIEQGLARYDTMCREKAVAALAEIGSPEALRALRRAVFVADAELQDLILMALKRSRPMGREQPRLRGDRKSGAGVRWRDRDGSTPGH